MVTDVTLSFRPPSPIVMACPPERNPMNTTTNLTPEAIVVPINGDLVVQVHYPWAGVDRPHTHGWNVGFSSPAHSRLASRLCRAIEAGVVEQNRRIATDVNGKTYVASASAVLGRTLNADLTRLGF